VFEQFVKRPFQLAQYRNGPYAEERSRFMERLVQEGRCVGRLKALIRWDEKAGLRGQTSQAAMPELSGMSRLRSSPSTLDAWVRPFRRTTLQPRPGTQESAAGPSFGIVPSAR